MRRWLPLGLAALAGTAAAKELPNPLATEPPLVELLYGGETGADARSQGDRIRLLIWIRSLTLDPQELTRLHQASQRTQALHLQLESDLSVAAGAEAEALAVPYAALEQALLMGQPSSDDLAEFSQQIQAARLGLVDPRERKARFADAVLQEASLLLAEWEAERRLQVADALFVLRDELGEGSTPAAWEHLLGPAWRTEDFSTTRRSASPASMGHLDIGGLWTLDAGATNRAEQVQADQQLVILAMVLAHPATESACLALVEAQR